MKPAAQSWIRFAVVMTLLLVTAVFLHARIKLENMPGRTPLADFPMKIGERVGQNVTIPQDQLNVLGDGDFLYRLYLTRSSPVVDLFIAYFPTQRTGSTIHSPQNCLPGAGWIPVETDRIIIPRPEGKSLTVNRLTIAKGLDRQIVLYWYQSHGRVLASEYSSKFYLVADSIRMHRSDGALVRVITPLSRGETEESAQARAINFTQELLPLLGSYIPR
jgi:EpsI family protein